MHTQNPTTASRGRVPSAGRSASRKRASRPGRARFRPGQIVGAVAAIGVLTAGGVVAYQEHCCASTGLGAIDLVVNIDNQTAAPDLEILAPLVSADAHRYADAGGGQLRTWIVAGDPAQRVAETSLEIRRDGRPEGDQQMRDAAVDAIVDDQLAALAVAVPTGAGRSYWSMFGPLEPPASGEWVVYVYTIGLPTDDPEDARLLTAAEARAAVESLPDSAVADLRGATVIPVFGAPAGDQDPLTPATAAWRAAYFTAYIERAGGQVARGVEIGGVGDSVPGAPDAPVVDNLADETWAPPPPPQPDVPYLAAVDGASLFRPDSAELIDPDAALAALAPLAEAWATGLYSEADCYARAARFNDAEVARELTEHRAAVGVDLLAQLGIPAEGHGLGFDNPLPGIDPQSPLQRELRCILTP